MSNTNLWDRPKLERLKEARSKAIEAGHSTFDFEGQQVLVSYAKYLIEYLEMQLQA